ncbi:MAG TPA: inner membrane-spanning protein YciB [Steroidobacteraceae bacterium]|nr:inner membrane-spanning protein YciB [Steroidobacteraceae bacterium]
MQSLIEFFPLAAFFIAWALGGIYVATGVLMAAMALLLAWDWFRTRTIPKMHLVSAVLVWVFGGITLVLHDVRFIQWKATVFYWAIAALLAGSVWIGRQTLLERLIGSSIPEDHRIEPTTWRSLSLVSALFYAALGATNIWIAYHMSEAAWVIFKSWITIPLLLAFNVVLIFWLLRGYEQKDPPETPS